MSIRILDNKNLLTKIILYSDFDSTMSFKLSKRKIGRNLVINCLGLKRIIGIPDTIFAYILTNIGMFIVEFGWIISNNYYFPYLNSQIIFSN